MRLIKGMYGHEFGPQFDNPLFKLVCGQMRANDIVHNGGWYNQLGEKLGWGDLDGRDMKRIAAELEPGETFVVLHESASFWRFVQSPGPIGSMSVVDREKEQAPGVDFIKEHASWIIQPKRIYCVSHERDIEEEGVTDWRDPELVYTVIGRTQAAQLL